MARVTAGTSIPRDSTSVAISTYATSVTMSTHHLSSNPSVERSNRIDRAGHIMQATAGSVPIQFETLSMCCPVIFQAFWCILAISTPYAFRIGSFLWETPWSHRCGTRSWPYPNSAWHPCHFPDEILWIAKAKIAARSRYATSIRSGPVQQKPVCWRGNGNARDPNDLDNLMLMSVANLGADPSFESHKSETPHCEPEIYREQSKVCGVGKPSFIVSWCFMMFHCFMIR